MLYYGVCRPPFIRISDRVNIPQDSHPEINFVGLLIGPRGNTLRNIEKEVYVATMAFSVHQFNVVTVIEIGTETVFFLAKLNRIGTTVLGSLFDGFRLSI